MDLPEKLLISALVGTVVRTYIAIFGTRWHLRTYKFLRGLSVFGYQLVPDRVSHFVARGIHWIWTVCAMIFAFQMISLFFGGVGFLLPF
jgi:hypothetical protein